MNSRMADQVDILGDIVTIRENGQDVEGNPTVRIEVRALICYTRTLLDNNNQFVFNRAPGFRLEDFGPNILSVLQMYHEHRSSNPCK